MLTETANEAYREAFHKNEGQFERVTDPGGNETLVHRDQLSQALENGYGRAPSAMTMVMPEVPWPRKLCGPGRHRFRYDKASRQMVEVS